MAKPSKQEKLDTITAEIDKIRRTISYWNAKEDMYAAQLDTCRDAVTAMQSAIRAATDVLGLVMGEPE